VPQNTELFACAAHQLEAVFGGHEFLHEEKGHCTRISNVPKIATVARRPRTEHMVDLRILTYDFSTLEIKMNRALQEDQNEIAFERAHRQ
jgi:hypothetical protein